MHDKLINSCGNIVFLYLILSNIYIWSAVANFGGSFFRDIDGQRYFGLDDPESIQGLEFMVSLFQDGTASSSWWGRRTQGNWAMGLWYVHDMPNLTTNTERDYGIVPVPKGPGTDEHIVDMWAQWMGVIPIYVENPRAVIEVVQALWQLTDSYIDDLDTWEEEYWFTSPGFGRYVSDRATYETWQWMVANARTVVPSDIQRAMLLAGWDINWSDFYIKTVNEGASVTSYIEEKRPAIQAELDALLNR